MSNPYPEPERSSSTSGHVALLPQVDIDTTRGRGKGKIDAETAASQILNGIAKGRAEIDMGAMALLHRILRLSLALRERIMIGR